MDILYAPWRSLYVKKDATGDAACPFCVAAESADDQAHLVLDRGDGWLVLMNAFPYNSGHLLIIPAAHAADISTVGPQVRAAMMEASVTWTARLQAVLKCHGFNIGFNLGTVSGGSIPGHLHMHIVPRWQGDTNFLATIGQVKLISSDITQIYQALLSCD